MTKTDGYKIGLALGGGSARGLAHIPMVEAFDELGLKPAAIAGSSMGSLVAAAYAAGMSGKDMRKQAETILNNRMDAARYVFGAKKSRITEFFSIKGFVSMHVQGEKLASLIIPPEFPQNIEDCLIPLMVVTTDYQLMEEHVITTGKISTAVGASIAIPGMIAAPLIDGRIHVDGGISNPVPFNLVTEGMDLTVAVDVNGKPRRRRRKTHSNVELAMGSMIIMFNQIAELRRTAAPPDIYIKPSVQDFAGYDFFKVREIFSAASASKEELKRELDKRMNRLIKNADPEE